MIENFSIAAGDLGDIIHQLYCNENNLVVIKDIDHVRLFIWETPNLVGVVNLLFSNSIIASCSNFLIVSS